MPVLAGLAAAIGGAFGLAVLNQFRTRRKPYQAAWGAALLMFGLAALFETIGLAQGWSDPVYRGYYLFGALLTVGWLGVGEVYLLAPRRWGHVAALVMAVLSLASIVAIAVAPVDVRQLHQLFPNDRKATKVPAILPVATNVLGSVILIGGAAWSAWKGYRRDAPAGRVLGTVLLAVGAFVVAGFHSGAVVAQAPALRPVSEAVGIALMFAGYLAVEARRIPLLQPKTA